MEELLALVGPEVSWSPVLRFLEGERPPSAIAGFGAGFAALGSPIGASGRCRTASRITARARLWSDGWSARLDWEKGISTFALHASGPSARSRRRGAGLVEERAARAAIASR
jgi:hypothetical protein